MTGKTCGGHNDNDDDKHNNQNKNKTDNKSISLHSNARAGSPAPWRASGYMIAHEWPAIGQVEQSRNHTDQLCQKQSKQSFASQQPAKSLARLASHGSGTDCPSSGSAIVLEEDTS